MSQQGNRQASVRLITGTALTYEGDWHALFTAASVPTGTFDERLLGWINIKLSAAYSNLPQAQQALATSLGATNFGAIGTFDASTVLAIAGVPGPATQNVAYSFSPVAAGGTPPYTFSKPAGTLPTGLSLNTATGVISGTPTVVATSSGITERVTDSLSATADLTGLSFVVSAPLVLTNSPATTGNVGVAYSYTPTTTGGRGTITWAITNKPTWANFSTSTGALTGTPSGAETDTGVNITGTDADGRTVSTGAFTITVSATAISDITQAEVKGVTALDPDSGSPIIGMDVNGVGLRIRTLALDQVSVPDVTKLTLATVDGGFDNNGGAGPFASVNRTRNLVPYANALLHRQATAGGNQAKVYCEQAGAIVDVSALTVGQPVDWFVMLPGIIYPTAVSLTLTASAGWYSTAAAGSGPTVSNNSTKPPPQPKFGWMNMPDERVEASSLVVELWCNAHRYAMNAQAVCGVDLWATDGTNTGPVSSVYTTTLGTLQTREAIAEVHHANLSLTGVNDTTGTTTRLSGVQEVDGYIYPWIGPRYQLSVDGLTALGPQPCRPLRFVKDTAGKYGGAIAYVFTGVGATPAVSRTPAGTQVAALASAYGTIATALTAIAAFNNASTGRPAGAITHNDLGGGSIHFLDAAGIDQGYELAANISQTAGNCWFDFANASEVNTARGFYKAVTAAARNVPDLTRFKCDWERAVAAQISGGSTTQGSTVRLAIDGAATNITAGTSSFLQKAGLIFQRNVNHKSATAGSPLCLSLGNEGTSGLQCAMAVGITYGTSATTQNVSVIPYFAVGVAGRLSPTDPSASLQTTNDGWVLDNFGFYGLTATLNLGAVFASVRGFAFTQGVTEYIAGQDFGLSGTVTGGAPNMDDCICDYVTNPPDVAGFAVDLGRLNGPYNDSAGARGRIAMLQTRGYGGARRAQKSDVFSVVNDSSHSTGNVGNLLPSYGVECYGYRIAISRPPSFTVGIVVQKVWDANSLDNLGDPVYTSNKAGVGQAGFGTYSLPSGANAYKNAIPAGKAMRKYDFFGNLRKNDGTGAPGIGEGS